jgi:nucleotide-binding universal stress UspA family protein
MARIRKILYPSDFSPESRRAFTTAVAMATSNGAALTILHVIVPIVPLLPEQAFDSATWQRVDTLVRRRGHEQLTRLAARARKAGVRASTLLMEGDPAQHIVRALRSTKADLVVMGTHGRKGFSKFFLGSVAERVIATASCPVVTVRGR